MMSRTMRTPRNYGGSGHFAEMSAASVQPASGTVEMSMLQASYTLGRLSSTSTAVRLDLLAHIQLVHPSLAPNFSSQHSTETHHKIVRRGVRAAKARISRRRRGSHRREDIAYRRACRRGGGG